MLQTRNGKRTGAAMVRIAMEMLQQGMIDEKTALLADLQRRGGRLFFTHDPQVASCRLAIDDQGAVVAREPEPALVAATA
jgi:hypothetical protein